MFSNLAADYIECWFCNHVLVVENRIVYVYLE